MNIVFHKENQDWLDAINVEPFPEDEQLPIVMSIRGVLVCSAADIIRLHKIGTSLLKFVHGGFCTNACENICTAAYIHEHYVRSLAQLSIFKPHESRFGASALYGGTANFLPRWTFGNGICTVSLRNIRVWHIDTITVPAGILLNRDLGFDYTHIDHTRGGAWGPSVLAEYLNRNKYVGEAMWAPTGSPYFTIDSATGALYSATSSSSGYGHSTAPEAATSGTWYSVHDSSYLRIFPRNQLVRFQDEYITLERMAFGKDLPESVFKSKIGRLLFEFTRAHLRAQMKESHLPANARIVVATGISLKATLPITLPITSRTVETLVRQLEFKEVPRKRKRGKLWI